MKFCLGTTNPFKIQEIASILGPLRIPLEVTDPIDPEETEATFLANARIKAEAYSAHVGRKYVETLMSERGCSRDDARSYLRMRRVWTISEDSGLAVPALGGLPGPWSARFDDCIVEGGRIMSHRSSGRSRDEIDVANNRRILEMMAEIEQPYRTASFVLALMVADIDGNIVFSTEGISHGWIAKQGAGASGFGYDPIFASGDSYGHTWSELDSMRKNLISHRRKALVAFTRWLASQIKMSESGKNSRTNVF